MIRTTPIATTAAIRQVLPRIMTRAASRKRPRNLAGAPLSGIVSLRAPGCSATKIVARVRCSRETADTLAGDAGLGPALVRRPPYLDDRRRHLHDWLTTHHPAVQFISRRDPPRLAARRVAARTTLFLFKEVARPRPRKSPHVDRRVSHGVPARIAALRVAARATPFCPRSWSAQPASLRGACHALPPERGPDCSPTGQFTAARS